MRPLDPGLPSKIGFQRHADVATNPDTLLNQFHAIHCGGEKGKLGTVVQTGLRQYCPDGQLYFPIIGTVIPPLLSGYFPRFPKPSRTSSSFNAAHNHGLHNANGDQRDHPQLLGPEIYSNT